MESFCRIVDTINEWAGKAVGMLFIPLILIMTLEVVLRYFFNMPTIWVWDVSIQLMAAIATLGAGYTLLKKGHVIVDVLVDHFGPRTRARINLLTYLVFFISFCSLLYISAIKAKTSVITKELYTSIWQPPLYPLRVAVVIGLLLLLLQGIANYIRDISLARKS